MYDGSNATALRSRRWLGDALVRLMERQRYPEITIGAICREADLSRQTFYNVFDSKEEVLRFYLRSRYETQFDRFREQRAITVGEIVEVFAVLVEENQQLLRRMVDNGLEGILSDEMTRCVALFGGRFVRKDRLGDTFPYSEVMVSGALGCLLIYWFRQEKPISIGQLTALITDFLEGRLFDLMAEEGKKT